MFCNLRRRAVIEGGMKDVIQYVGLDVHKETIAASVAECNGGQVRYFGEIANTAEAIEKPGS